MQTQNQIEVNYSIEKEREKNIEETKKSYIVYTDNTTDDNGNVRVYASIFNPKSETTELKPIESDREWKIVETILESIQEDNNKE